MTSQYVSQLDNKFKIMNDVLNIGIADIIGREHHSSSFNNDIIIIELKGDGDKKTNFKQDTKMRFDAISIILMLEGEIHININNTDYHFNTQIILDILEMHVFQNMRISDDFKGYHLIISKNFIKEVMQGVKHVPLTNYLSRLNYPVEQITLNEAELLHEGILRITKSLANTNHCYHREMIKNELRSFIMEISNIIIPKNEIANKRVLRDKNEIIMKFIHLLNTHCKEQHNVEFYANELCIDPKYLSRILKSLNGTSASKWIDEALLNEAQLHLRDNSLSIQQIADVLNFSDQSAFGKFFKKHVGTSPANYRNERFQK